MEKNIFCFQCEQTGCGGCTGIVGICGKKADTAVLQDELTGALIGLARSAEGNEHLINSNTYQMIIEGLFTTLANVNFDNDAIRNQIALVYMEIFQIVAAVLHRAAKILIMTCVYFGMRTKISVP